VKITGKHIKNDAKIGTFEDFSQIIASMIIDTIGVERITITSGFIKSYKKSFKPQIKPKIIPRIQDKINPRIVLIVLLKIIAYVVLSNKIPMRVLKVEIGEGRYISLFTIKANISHITNQNNIINNFLRLFFIIEVFIR
jgi:hypothetical protein